MRWHKISRLTLHKTTKKKVQTMSSQTTSSYEYNCEQINQLQIVIRLRRVGNVLIIVISLQPPSTARNCTCIIYNLRRTIIFCINEPLHFLNGLAYDSYLTLMS